jgi:hypothetical protein
MMPKKSEAANFFECPALDSLSPAQIPLSAPSLRDIAQINVGKFDTRPQGIVRLNMTIDLEGVIVEREDRRPLQVEINMPWFAEPQPVFVEPVGSLRLARTTLETTVHGRSTSRQGWTTIGEAVEVTDIQRLAYLAGILGSSGIKKQLR